MSNTAPTTAGPVSTGKQPRHFALAGEIVGTSARARQIAIQAIKDGREYLISQAESVMRQLRAAGQ